MHISINPLPPKVSEKSLSKREDTVILCAWSESVPSTPDHITSHAEVLDGPVLCPALLRPDNVSSGRHQGVGVTDIVLGWVIDRHHT